LLSKAVIKREVIMDSVRKYLSKMELDKKEVFRNLTMFAIQGAPGSAQDYLTLADAMRLEVAKVSEISDGGSVPELLFENSADLPVLIFDGEELVGAKQNRTVNLTILAPAGKTIKVPVSCVEAGRWRRESSHLEMSGRHHFARGRAVRNASVSNSMRLDGSRRSDQRRVWADISAKASRMEAPSATQAMAEIFDRHRSSTDSFVEAFTCSEEQTGALFAIGSGIVGLDLFDRHTTLAAMLPKLVRSYAIDAIETEGEDEKLAKKKDAKEFLARLAMAEIQTFEAVGLGTDLRIVTPGIVGGGLAVNGSLVHLAAFTADSEAAESDPGTMARMRSRRRSYGRR
jgi:hypothetical protein